MPIPDCVHEQTECRQRAGRGAVARLVRVHGSGDFYSQDGFDAWLEVAREWPATVFHFYTTPLSFWVARLAEGAARRKPSEGSDFPFPERALRLDAHPPPRWSCPMFARCLAGLL